MRPLPALFVDTRRNIAVQDSVAAHDFSMAYLVGGTMEQSSDFLRTHHALLTTIPHITFEITTRETLHLVTRIPAITRLSVPHEWLLPDLENFFAVDAIIQWDHRRPLAYYQDILMQLCARHIHHLSVYGLQDFATWKNIQDFIKPFGFSFYERFHAARDNCHSPYQRHLSAAHDVLAWGGWSRITDDNNIMHVRGPRAKRWTTLSPAQAHSEKILLGLAARSGVPLSFIPHDKAAQAIKHGLAYQEDVNLMPTDEGLWHGTTLAAHLL